MKRLFDITFKDLLQMSRNVFAIGMSVLAPLLITGLLYLAFGGLSSRTPTDMPKMTVGVVNLDQPSDPNVDMGSIVAGMYHDSSVRGWMEAFDYQSEADARQAILDQKIGTAIIIPENFSQAVVYGKPAALKILNDPTLAVAPGVVSNMAASVINGVDIYRTASDVINRQAASRGVQLDTAAREEIAAKFKQWYVTFEREIFHGDRPAVSVRPASGSGLANEGNFMARMLSLCLTGQMIFFGFYTGAYSMMSILREQEEGTLARLFTTPTDRTIILAGKLMSVILTVIIQAAVMLLCGHFMFGVNWGDPVNVALMILGQVVASSGFGVLIISLIKNTRQSGAVMGGLLSAMGMLGGLFTVGAQMPAAFETVNLFTPQGWVLRGWKLTLQGATLPELAVPLMMMLLLGAVMFALGAFKFRRRLA